MSYDDRYIKVSAGKGIQKLQTDFETLCQRETKQYTNENRSTILIHGGTGERGGVRLHGLRL